MKKKCFTALIGLITTALLAAQAHRPAAENLPSAPVFDYQTVTLKNGLKVIVLEDFSAPLVSVQVWYHVGSKDEPEDRQGYAHLFEHMMFKGTDRLADEDHFRLIRQVGGECNAFTSFDTTVYYQTLPASELELALWLEAERMSFLRIDQPAFDTERQVVEEELRMGENRPYGNVFKKMARNLFDTLPYRWTPIGRIADLRASSVADVRQFWLTWYVPNNATLVIVGAVPAKKAFAAAARYFEWIPASPLPERTWQPEPQPTISRTIVIDDENAPAGQVVLCWRTVPAGHPDQPALECLADILGGGKSSRLWRQLVAEQRQAVSAETWTYHLELAGLFGMEATLPDDSEDYELLAEQMASQVLQIAQNGIQPQELQKAKNRLLKEWVTDTLGVEKKAMRLGRAAVVYKDLEAVNRYWRDLQAVQPDDIQRVANRWLDLKRNFRFLIKKNPDGMRRATTDDDTAPLTATPETTPLPPGRPGVVRPVHFPAEPPVGKFTSSVFDLPYRKTTLANGLTLYVISNHSVPFLSITFGVPFGSAAEDKPAAAAMTMQMLPKGTENRSEAQIADLLDRYAIGLQTSVDKDSSVMTVDCLSYFAPQALDLMADMLQQPTFPADQWQTVLAQQIAESRVRNQQPEYLAKTAFYAALFADHPYGKPTEGQPDQLAALTRQDFARWHRHAYLPSKAALIFAGDIPYPQAVRLAEQYFSHWQAHPTADLPAANRPLPPWPAKPRIVLVDRPGSRQTQLHIGHFGITRRQQPDYFYALLAGNYFGGAFNSRLNKALRIDSGLTYGVFGGFLPLADAGTFEIMTFTRNETTGKAVELLIEQIRQLRTVPPSEQELMETQRFLLGSFARQRETPQQMARDIWMIHHQRLQPDYLKRLFSAIAKAAPQQVFEFAHQLVQPDKLIITAVGDAAAIQSQLEPFGAVELIRR